jgi:hypothetical protein
MIKSLIVVISLVVLGTAASAYAGQVPIGPSVAQYDHLRPVVSSSGKVRYVYKNAMSCAPEQALAVWAPGRVTASPLGYRCSSSANGG